MSFILVAIAAPKMAVFWVPLILGVLSTLGTAYGAYSQSQAQKQQASTAEKNAEYQEKQAELNAQHAQDVAENKAQRETQQRTLERSEEKRKSRRMRSVMEAGYAKSGVLLDGTPSAYLVDQATTDELNVQRADQASEEKKTGFLFNADQQSFNFKRTGMENAANLRNKASSLLSASKTGLITGGISSIGAGFGTYSKASKLSFLTGNK